MTTVNQPPEGFPTSFGLDVTVSDIDLDTEEVIVGGERLTEQGAAELAGRVQRGVTGRPSLSAPGKRSPTLNLRIPVATRTRLDQVAESQGRRPSDVVRDALEEYLARS